MRLATNALRHVLPTLALLVATTAPTLAQLIPPNQNFVLRFARQHIAIAPDDARLDLSGGDFTLTGWFYLEQAEAGAVLMGRANNPWTAAPYLAEALEISGEGFVRFHIGDTVGGETFFVGDTAPSLHQWFHVAAVLAGDTMRLYLDGTEVGAKEYTGTRVASATRFAVGAGATEEPVLAYGSGMVGMAQQVSVWSVALAAQDIADLANNGATASDSGLVAYWTMDTYADHAATDAGPHGLDLQFDQDIYFPSWRQTDPTYYPAAAVADPYYEVVWEMPWYEEKGIENWSAQGVYPIDFDQDGFEDVVISYVNWPATIPATETQLHALRNKGDGTFEDVTDQVLGTVNVVLPRFSEQADFDADGDSDLYLADSGTDTWPIPGRQNTLLLQQDDGTLSDASLSHLPHIDNANHGATSGDIDNDGDIDIVVTSQGRATESGTFHPEIFVNDGSGHFSLRENSALRALGQSISCLLADIDRDGSSELLLGYEGMSQPIGLMLENDAGNFYYAQSGGLTGNAFYNYADKQSFVEMRAGDVDGDGWLDVVGSSLFEVYMGSRVELLRNGGDGSLNADATAFNSVHLGPRSVNYWIIYLHLADMNGDGWLDVFGEGQQAGDFLFLNRGDGRFDDVSTALPPHMNAHGSATALLDVDNDGTLDIFSVSYERIQVVLGRRSLDAGATALTPPSAPVLADPPDNADTGIALRLRWSEDRPFAHSDVQVATDASFADVVFARQDLTKLDAVIGDLQRGQDYYWRVRGTNSAGRGDWSAARRFSVLPTTSDFNRSGAVDFDDFFLFSDFFGSDESLFDINGNGVVDFADFFAFADAFGK